MRAVLLVSKHADRKGQRSGTVLYVPCGSLLAFQKASTGGKERSYVFHP